MKLELHQELSQPEAERLSEKLPLPTLSESDKQYAAESMIRDSAAAIARATLAGERYPLKKRINERIRSMQEGDRWQDFINRHELRWDSARGKFLVFNPTGAQAA